MSGKENLKNCLQDFKPGPFGLLSKKKAKFDWKDMKILFEGEEMLTLQWIPPPPTLCRLILSSQTRRMTNHPRGPTVKYWKRHDSRVNGLQ
ncbi:hypothetical protein CEXT_76721 [Caerostris extrusa]|uniref:Uncharacterized protein n=1 Tax=Caerostris extrusa TaxID=172846 RepID=A0AAV4UBA7_CAEEX|nr:hypothetical protein CEXT_76721 [Caerostris extrusa]